MSADRKKNFFELLKKKLEKQPDRRFDQVFWSKFEREFGNSPFSPQPTALDRMLSIIRPVRYLVGAAGAAALAVAIFVKAPWKDSALQPMDLAEIETTGPVIAHLGTFQGVLDNLDLFETLDDVDLSDQEWNDLLKETVG